MKLLGDLLFRAAWLKMMALNGVRIFKKFDVFFLLTRMRVLG